MKHYLLIVDDEESVRESFRLALQDHYELIFAVDVKSTLKALKLREFDLCLLDILLPDGSGMDLLKQAKRKDETMEIIMVTAVQGVKSALDAMKLGAYDYVTKPFKLEELYAVIQRALQKRALLKENRYLKESRQNEPSPSFIGSSPAFKNFIKKVEGMAAVDFPVLLLGELGSGSEVIARELHGLSARSKGPFVRLNCSSVPRGQWEIELFGQEGDDSKKRGPQLGKLDFAQGGTLFLDQIDLMPTSIQDKFAEVLKDKRFSGSDNKIVQEVDVRVIASLEVELSNIPFVPPPGRELFQILNAFSIVIPPLRERKEDLKELIFYYLKKSSQRAALPVKTLQKDALKLLLEYPWPGNLRELEAVIEMMVLFAGKEILGLEDLPLDLLVKQMDLAPSREEAKISLKRVRNQFERRYIRKVLERTRGNQTRTAATLGLHRNTLIWKLRELDLEDDYKKIVKQRRDRGIGFKDL